MSYFWIKRVLGVVSLLLGVMKFSWLGYNLFWPTKEFEASFHGFFHLATAVALVFAGWKLLRDGGLGLDDLEEPDPRSPEVEEARRLCHETLPDFIAEVEARHPVAFVKFPMLQDEVLGKVLSVRDGVFNVAPLVDHSETQNVPAAVVLDWQIVEPDGRLRGAWELRAAVKYHERHGTWFSPRMKKERALFFAEE